MAKILVVDDSMVMRRNIISILKHGGHEIIGEANNGRNAYLKYLDLKPDLVTMDISMPNTDGVEAVSNIIAKFPEAKIIMVSAVNQKQMVLKAIAKGAMHYIVKPIDPDKFLQAIYEVMNGK